MVLQSPSKPKISVRFRLPAPSPCGGIGRHTGLKILRPLGRASSSLAGGTKYWDIAQLVEQVTVNHPVAGSSPAIPAKFTRVVQRLEPRPHKTFVGGSNPSPGTIGDKCYGSTAGSNPASVGSTPTSSANKYSSVFYSTDEIIE